MKNSTFSIRDHESGNVIDEFDSLAEAQEQLALYLQEDKDNGEYQEDSYEIYDNDKQEVVEVA